MANDGQDGGNRPVPNQQPNQDDGGDNAGQDQQ